MKSQLLKLKKTSRNDLPFIGSRKMFGEALFWAVPATGGYHGGYETGRALANIHMKHERSDGNTGPATLTWVVISFMHRVSQAGGLTAFESHARSEELAALKGQMAGYLNTIAAWAAVGARSCGAELDAISEQSLLDTANAGLTSDDVSFVAALMEGKDA